MLLDDSERLLQVSESLSNYARRRFGIKDTQARDVSDILQQTFLTYVGVRDKYPKDANDIVILFSIFGNKCQEDIRKEREEKRMVEERDPYLLERGYLLEGSAPSSADTLIREETSQAVDTTLKKVYGEGSPRQRELLERMLSDEGLDRRTAAEELGVCLDTLDSRTRELRIKVEKELHRNGVEYMGPLSRSKQQKRMSA